MICNNSAKIYVPIANNVEFEQDRFFYVQLGVPKRPKNDTHCVQIIRTRF